MQRALIVITAVLAMMQAAYAQPVKPREGWVVIETRQPYSALVGRLEAAIKNEKMGLVTIASASEGAKAAGFTIPGNRIFGVFRNDFARRMLSASVSAGIEAPVRIYVTEGPGAAATLSYKKPSLVFAPYKDEGGEALRALAAELDAIFSAIAQGATKEP
jgi:uncharacterized protein (DUF302 family)